MHGRAAAILQELRHLGIAALFIAETLAKLADDMAKPMDLLLPHDMTFAAACILDVLLPAQHLPNRAWLRAVRLPDVDRDDQAVAARLVVEHELDGRVGIDAAIPIGLTIDAHGWEARRQR